MRLKELTIAGFRGFKLPQPLPLDADIVVIHGPNGSGKSSIVEALEWLLCGDISRHERARSPSEYRGDYLRNVHCSENAPTFVEARVVLDNRELTLRREYQSPRLSRILVDESEVADLSVIGIPIERHTRPILSQGEIKGLVDTEQSDRYSEIARILGLDVLGELRQNLMDLKKNMNKDTTISEAIKLRDARAEDLRQYEELRLLSDAMESMPYEHQKFLKMVYSCVKVICGIEVSSPDQSQKALKKERDRIVRSSPELSKLKELRIPGEVTPTSELLEALLETVKISDRLKAFATQMMEMRQACFLKAGIDLISDSICPFCLQQTITEARKNDIRAHLQVHEEGLKLEGKLGESLGNFSSRWQTVVQDLRAKVGIQTDIKAALDEALSILGKTSDIDALREFHDARLPELQAQVDRVNQEVEQFIKSCTNLLKHQPDISIEDLIALAGKIRPSIEQICARAYSDVTELATLKSKILSSTPGMSPEMDRKIKMVMELERLVENSEHVKLAGIYGNRSSELEELQSKVEEFERARMEGMLSDLSDDISRYYDKLNPGEPIKFTRLATAKPGQRHIRMEGESYGKDLNPISCFSEAHVNCLGISLYLCQRVSRNPRYQFFVLDDPIQSMDEPHADRLVDVLREISQEKQLIVLTQEKALCDILDDVFREHDYIKYSCGVYGKDGPKIELEIGSIERNLHLAKTSSRGTKDDRINKAAGSVRKAMEAIIKELLVDKCGVTRMSLRTQRVKLSRRLSQLENSGFDRDDIVNMRTILPIVDQPHHDDPNWDIPPQRIERAVEILESICKKHRLGPYRIARTIVGRVRNYLPKIGVAVVKVKQPFSVGENLIIEGTTTCIQMPLDSMELDRQKIGTAEPGAIVGIKVPDKVRPNDLVYKIMGEQ
ncbi:MAG: hypothetical protein COS87_00390 [Chloroflexi bacterium CG07_land_8_20_14_0_80_45_17]|nr:MAG: hypothetical protein COS87_00390 [Chloroflexi bacterium CG07_land_8_20_14_0_80_45_17]